MKYREVPGCPAQLTTAPPPYKSPGWRAVGWLWPDSDAWPRIKLSLPAISSLIPAIYSPGTRASRAACHVLTPRLRVKAGKRTEKWEKCRIKGKESHDAENSTHPKLSVVLRRNKSVPPSSHRASSWRRVGTGIRYFWILQKPQFHINKRLTLSP